MPDETVTWIILSLVSNFTLWLPSGMHPYIWFPCFQTVPFAELKRTLANKMTDTTWVDLTKSWVIITRNVRSPKLHTTLAGNLDNQYGRISALMAITEVIRAIPLITHPDWARFSLLINDNYCITQSSFVRLTKNTRDYLILCQNFTLHKQCIKCTKVQTLNVTCHAVNHVPFLTW